MKNSIYVASIVRSAHSKKLWKTKWKIACNDPLTLPWAGDNHVCDYKIGSGRIGISLGGEIMGGSNFGILISMIWTTIGESFVWKDEVGALMLWVQKMGSFGPKMHFFAKIGMHAKKCV